MKAPGKTTIKLVILLLGIVACIAWLSRDLFAETFDGVASSRLAERIAQYESSRESNDWESVYELVDPKHRKIVDKDRFLNIFGSGVLHTREVETVSSDIDSENRTAKVVMKTDGELVVERLPPRYRRSLKVTDPAQLRRQSDLELTWVWRDGNWYFQLDRNILTGRNSEGREIRAVKNAPAKKSEPGKKGK